MRTLILGLVLACGLSAQVVFDHSAGLVNGTNFCGNGGTAAVGAQLMIASCTWPHQSFGNGSNRALFVAVVGLGAGDPTSVTMDGTPLTLLAPAAAGAWTTQVWGIANPPVATHTMVVNWPILTANYQSFYMFSFDAFGVNQTTLADAITDNASNTATVTTTVAGDLLVGVVASDGNTATSMTASTGQTEILSGSGGRNDGRSPVIGAIGYKAGAPLGANTMTWTSTLRTTKLPGPTAAAPQGIALVAIKAVVVAPTFTITPTAIPANHAGNITLSLVGTNTAWGATTRFALSGVTGMTCVTGCTNSPTITDATHAAVVVSTGSGTGTLTLTESVTGTTAATTAVGNPALSISPFTGQLNITVPLTLTGTNTVWNQETAAGMFTVTGGTGASIATPTITSNTAATAVLTVGSATGNLTIHDTKTGATAVFTASATCTTGGGGSYPIL